MGLTPELPQLPAGDGPVAGMLVSEGLCPWCGSDLEPRSNNEGPATFGWCEVDAMGWSLSAGAVEPSTWWWEDCQPETRPTGSKLVDDRGPVALHQWRLHSATQLTLGDFA